MGGHVGRAHERLAGGDSRRHDGIGEDAFFHEVFPELEAGIHIADQDRDDGRLAGPHVEAGIAEAVAHVVGDFPEPVQPLGFFFEDIEALQNRGHIGGGHRSAEDMRGAGMADELDHLPIARAKAAQ